MAYGERQHVDHRGRGPRNYRRSDARIAEEVSERLSDDPDLDASDIEVSVTGGEVTLTGTVATRHDRRRAELLVEGITGVSYVQNNIHPRQPGRVSLDTSHPGGGRKMTAGTVAGTNRATSSSQAPASATHMGVGQAVSEGPVGTTTPDNPTQRPGD